MADLAPGVVTLFGGSGFIGSQAVRALARRGWRIRVAVRNPVLAIEIQPLGDPGQIQFMRCDITNPADVAQAVRGADAVVNLVGVLHDAGGKRGFDAVHTEAAKTIAEAAKAAGVERLVQISAIGADAASPSAYGRTKAQAEQAVRAVYPDAVILRPSLVFGAGDGFLNRFAAMATLSPVLPLIGGGETKFQPVYVGDVAEAIARGVTRADAAGRTYELGGPSLYTFREVLELVRRETGRDRMLVSVPFIVAKPLGSLLQLSRFVGLTPPLTRDQVLMLEKDNVVAADAFGLSDLGIDHPAGMAAIAPSYLWRYRVGGQFAEAPAH
ncbi:complex I NDUFA9 subunit family protein [Brevundimonas vesicularis]|uniref:Complex I NDUFA9 subunit family protein n=1 Tax=Brevundimonas vesicularis TaxID=41276 RepID=A0A1Z3U930_BREVE|nr:complex I NDUFA9 subunit family protein [Brevundimonas vesicularis]ASE39775.1 complex I NDUFA9 subunit family protein [Brevundimonas vesicularis]MDX2334968.1 complex I NDUFA9 subunit family protein [Brevundimonas vesicularis]